jgi:hypothetical protein
MADEKKPLAQGDSWRLPALKGVRQDVIEEVAACEFVPDACKAMLVEALEAFDPSEKLIRLDAHVRCVKTPQGHTHIGGWSITGL